MLRLRPFRKNDAAKIVTWTSQPDEFYKWSAGKLGSFPVSEERLLEATSGREENERYFPLTAFDEEGLVGFLTMRAPECDRNVLFGYVIINPEKRAMGYGKEMLRLAMRFAFDIYGAETAGLGVFDSNLPAYRCYSSLGFRETGERILFTQGGYSWTEIEMEMKNRAKKEDESNYGTDDT